MSSPLVSVIMPVRNRIRILEKSILSVLKQDYNNIELIIIDDASTDNIQKLVEEIIVSNSKVEINLIKLNKHCGAPTARNEGIKYCKGKYIAFLDSDDLWRPNKIKLQVEVLENKSIDVVFSNYLVYNGSSYQKISNPPPYSSIYQSMIEGWWYIPTSLIMGKKEVFMENLFDENLPFDQDFDLCLRISKKYDFYRLDKILMYKINNHGESQISYHLKRNLKSYKYLMRKYFHSELFISNYEDKIKLFKILISKSVKSTFYKMVEKSVNNERLSLQDFREISHQIKYISLVRLEYKIIFHLLVLFFYSNRFIKSTEVVNVSLKIYRKIRKKLMSN